MHEFMGMVDLTLNTELTDEQNEYLSKARTSANLLLALLTDMVDYAELQSGRLVLGEEGFDLWAVIGKIMAVMLSRAEEKGLDLDWDMSQDIPRDFIGDAERLRQVLSILVDNALKFTDEGEIRVLIEQEPAEKGVQLHFAVRDMGVGIPSDQLDSIFTSFHQVDNSTTRRFGGMGIGLSMASQLAELMGGRMWAESEVGVGSTFHFTVCLQEARKINTQSVIVLDNLEILLAEDSPTNQLLATANLKKAGHKVDVAKNGVQAIEALAKKQYDLVLMDVAMPEMDGIEATINIRAEEANTGHHIPIIAMTAFAMNEYREKCLNAGMDGYVTKPVSADELRKAIETFLASLSSAGNGNGHDQANLEPPVDLAAAMETAGDDLELLEAVVEISMDECDRLMGELQQAISKKDAGALEHAAHTLKGTIANIGALKAKDLAQKLETMGTDGEVNGAEPIYQALQPEVARILAFYKSPEWQQAVPTS